MDSLFASVGPVYSRSLVLSCPTLPLNSLFQHLACLHHNLPEELGTAWGGGTLESLLHDIPVFYVTLLAWPDFHSWVSPRSHRCVRGSTLLGFYRSIQGCEGLAHNAGSRLSIILIEIFRSSHTILEAQLGMVHVSVDIFLHSVESSSFT